MMHLILPSMKKRKEGCIINIASRFVEGRLELIVERERLRDLFLFIIMRGRQLLFERRGVFNLNLIFKDTQIFISTHSTPVAAKQASRVPIPISLHQLHHPSSTFIDV